MDGPKNNSHTQGFYKVYNTVYTHVSDFSEHEYREEVMCILNVRKWTTVGMSPPKNGF